MIKIKQFFWYQFPAIFWMSAIFIQSSIPDLSAPDFGFNLQDKVAHFIEFSILAFLLIRALTYHSNEFFHKNAAGLTLLIGVFYGLFDELHQSFVPGRAADINDVIADVLGVIFAVLIYYFTKRPMMSR